MFGWGADVQIRPGDGQEGLEAVTAVGLGGDRVMLDKVITQDTSSMENGIFLFDFPGAGKTCGL